MSKLDHDFIAQFAERAKPPERPRFEAIAEQLDHLKDGEAKFSGYLRPQDGGIQYPLDLYNPFQVEALIERNLRLLDTCLGLRNSYLDFQAQAETSDARYQLFQNLQAVDQKQDDYLATSNGSAAPAIAAQKEVRDVGGTQSATPSSLQWAQSREAQLRGFAQARREANTTNEAQLAARRTDPNDGLCFTARQQRIESRYQELLKDAAMRSWAISDGLQLVYSSTLPLPAQPTVNFLDDLVQWHKAVVDEMERILRRDSQYVLLLNLRNATADGGHVLPAQSATAAPRLVIDGWDSTRGRLTQNSLQFRLKQDIFFPDQNNIRLRGISIFIGTTTGIPAPAPFGTVFGLSIWRVKITPPPVSFSTGGVTHSLNVPAIYLGGVRERIDPDIKFAGGSYFNVDPCSGQWTVEISQSSSTAHPFTEITDVEIALLVATLPK